MPSLMIWPCQCRRQPCCLVDFKTHSDLPGRFICSPPPDERVDFMLFGNPKDTASMACALPLTGSSEYPAQGRHARFGPDLVRIAIDGEQEGPSVTLAAQRAASRSRRELLKMRWSAIGTSRRLPAGDSGRHHFAAAWPEFERLGDPQRGLERQRRANSGIVWRN